MDDLLTYTDFSTLETRFRANLINSISGFKSACLAGTVSPDCVLNLGVFNSVFHVGANPPLLGMVFRPAEVPRHTLDNIRKNKYFTLNHIRESFIKQAHQTSAKYSADVSEFEACGLEPVFGEMHNAPYVKNACIRIGLIAEEELPVKTNGTTILISRIVEIFVPSDTIEKDGTVNLEKAGTVAISGLDGYFNAKKICRLSYARPGKIPEEI